MSHPLNGDDRIQFEINIENKLYISDLRPTAHLISDVSLIQYVNKYNKDVITSKNARNSVYLNDLQQSKCFYQGKLQNVPDSSVALSVCDGLVSGLVTNFRSWMVRPCTRFGQFIKTIIKTNREVLYTFKIKLISSNQLILR